MARGGRIICKRAGSGGRKRPRRSKASDDDDDEEYVLEEEDEEESLDELLASDGEEEEYEFGESGGSDDGEHASEFDDEDEEFLAPRSKRRRKAAPPKPRKRVKKSRVSDDDDDDDYEEEEEDEEDEEDHISAWKRGRSSNLAVVRSRGQKSGSSDYEEEEEHISSRNSTRSRQFSTNRSGGLKSGSSDYEEEEEVHLSSKKKEVKSNPLVRSRKQIPGSSDYEEKEESRSAGNRGMDLAIVRSRSQNSGSSDYEDENEEEDDDEDEDVDFSLDEQDLDDEEVSMTHLQGRGNQKEGGKKRKSRVSRMKKGEKRYLKRSEDDDDWDDFIVKDHVPVNRKMNKSKKTIRKKNSTSRATRERSAVESDTSDFDFVTSDDDFMEDTTVSDGRTNKSAAIRKTNTTRTGKRKSMMLSEESESSTDDDYMISEEELRDLGVDGSLEQSQPKRVVTGRKGDEKGKEKENEELGNPLCGICLSEEQRTTVRGVLNCCTHFFCFACIIEWSKVESRCPVCKRRFETITKSSRSDPGFGLRKAVIKVEKRDQVYQPSEEEIRRMLDPYENVVCIECHQGGDDSLMLLCDICDSPAHTYCVGLGREVPEGNWYCECCRFAGDGSLFLQNQVVGTDQVASNNDFISSQIETEVVAARDSTHLQRSSQPFLHEIDLNVSPRAVEDYGSMSQPFGAGPSTLSGRRAIHQRIRILLSSSRQRQLVEETHGSHRNAGSDVMTSQIRQSGESLHDSPILVSVTEECHLNNRPSFESDVSLARCTTEGSSFQHLDGAKDQVQAVVKQHLKELSRDSSLDRATIKEIGRRSTHTILAACGIKHHRRMVSASIPPPSSCSHNQDQKISLISGCCFPCFSSYVKYVVQKILSAT